VHYTYVLIAKNGRSSGPGAGRVPDLSMQLAEDGECMLFSPDDVPDLRGLYAAAFAERCRDQRQDAWS
jgi:hypothetical protein